MTRRKRILCITDCLDDAQYIGRQLHGYDLTTAQDGYNALALLMTQSFDGVLIEIAMRECDGSVLRGAIQHANPNLTVFLFHGTGHSTDAQIRMFDNVLHFPGSPRSTIELAYSFPVHL